MLSNQNQPGIGSAKSSGGGTSILDVGVTPIVNGVNGRIFYQKSANTLGQSENLFFDEANGRLSVGQGNAPSARLDIRAQGGLSTDVVLRVRNNLNTNELFYLDATGTLILNNSAGARLITVNPSGATVLGVNAIATNTDSNDVQIGSNSSYTPGSNIRVLIGSAANGGGFYSVGIGGGASTVGSNGGVCVGWQSLVSGQAGLALGMSLKSTANYAVILGSRYGGSATNNISESLMVHLNNTNGGSYQALFMNKRTNIVLRNDTELTPGTHYDNSATNTITIHNGVAPTANISNAFQMYSEIAIPKFRLGNGDVIQLSRQNLPTTPTTAEIATLLSNLGFANLI